MLYHGQAWQSGSIWALSFAGLYALVRRYPRGAMAVGALVVSHWVLDLIAHRPDLPLLPGMGPRLGLGLWHSVPATLAAEGLLLGLGLYLYRTNTEPVDRIGTWALGTFALALVGLYLASVFGPPPAGRHRRRLLGRSRCGCSSCGATSSIATASPFGSGSRVDLVIRDPQIRSGNVFSLQGNVLGKSLRHDLGTGETIAGRSPSSQIVLGPPSVSRTHAKFRVDHDRCFVTDLGSRSGTFVGGGRISVETEVVAGDRDPARRGRPDAGAHRPDGIPSSTRGRPTPPSSGRSATTRRFAATSR